MKKLPGRRYAAAFKGASPGVTTPPGSSMWWYQWPASATRFLSASVSINEEDLRRNVEEMRELVIECGYGKAYADGRTIVTTQPEGKL